MGPITLGPIWKESGAKNKTPKTDIASSDFREKISLKKAILRLSDGATRSFGNALIAATCVGERVPR